MSWLYFRDSKLKAPSNIDVAAFDDITDKLLLDIAKELKDLEEMKQQLYKSYNNEDCHGHYKCILVSICEVCCVLLPLLYLNHNMYS